ncbi:MAG: hypothetical protein DDT30_02074 [Dehalococcoidia bacterium]|nr:hypothetical protein [Bacillota bacterium]MBT9143979.1 hypothetical protein [Bacillota bacterium]
MVGRLAPVITPCHGSLVAVDIDVSPLDNSKTKPPWAAAHQRIMKMGVGCTAHRDLLSSDWVQRKLP